MSDLEGIAKPGPELAEHIRRVAASLSKKSVADAQMMMNKVISTARRDQFLFFEVTNIFHPYFLSVLNDMRNNPALADEVRAKAEEAKASTTTSTTAAATAPSSATVAAATASSAVVVPAKLLRTVQEEAFQQIEDPHPLLYTLDLSQRNELSHAQFSIMSVTAQYAAKFGAAFLDAVQQTQVARATSSSSGSSSHSVGGAGNFKFLHPDDPWHYPFLKLVTAYATIVQSDPEAVEERLEAWSTKEGFLATCDAKRAFLAAEIARRKAALLTDDDLRQRLEWDVFEVVKSFSIAQLGLEPQVVSAPAQTGTQSSSTGLRSRQQNEPMVVVEDESYTVQGTVAGRSRRQIEAFVDTKTKMEVRPEELSNVGLGSGSGGAEQQAKRARDTASSALAADDEFERNLKRARGE